MSAPDRIAHDQAWALELIEWLEKSGAYIEAGKEPCRGFVGVDDESFGMFRAETWTKHSVQREEGVPLLFAIAALKEQVEKAEAEKQRSDELLAVMRDVGRL